MERNNKYLVLVYGLIVSLLTGMVFGWPALLVGLLVGVVARLIVGWLGLRYYVVGVVLGVVFLALIRIVT